MVELSRHKVKINAFSGPLCLPLLIYVHVYVHCIASYFCSLAAYEYMKKSLGNRLLGVRATPTIRTPPHLYSTARVHLLNYRVKFVDSCSVGDSQCLTSSARII